MNNAPTLRVACHILNLQAPKKPRHIATDVFVAAIDGMLTERMSVCSTLWDAGIKADFAYKAKPKLIKQFEHCDKDENQIPFVVILAGDEWSRGEVKIKEMSLPAGHPDVAGVTVSMSALVDELKTRLEGKFTSG